MEELKTCPLCGGDGEVLVDRIERWNTKALRTWDNITIMSPITVVSEGEPQTYVPLRTCRNTHSNRWFSCSECGYGFIDMFPCDETDINEQPHYCPNCGAKVVEE